MTSRETKLPDHADDRASRELARYLRAYAASELRTDGHGVRPSHVAESVAFICRNIADRFDTDVGKLSANLASAEQRVISAARDGRDREIREALIVLDAAQEAIDIARRQAAMKRLAG